MEVLRQRCGGHQGTGIHIYDIWGTRGGGQDFRLELPPSRPLTSPQHQLSQERQSWGYRRTGNQADLTLGQYIVDAH